MIHFAGQFDLQLQTVSECQWDFLATFDNGAKQSIYKIDVCTNPTVDLTGPKPGLLLWTGTGFFIGQTGHVLTNNHVVYGCGLVTIRHRTGGDLPLNLIDQNAEADLALLQESGVHTVGLDFRETWRSLRAGEKLVVLGYPLLDKLGSLIVNEGIVSSLQGGAGETSQFQMQVPIQPGNSGGPVFDDRGQVVGISVATLMDPKYQLVNFAVKVEAARQLALRNGVELGNTKIATPMTTADLVDALQDRVVALKCLN